MKKLIVLLPLLTACVGESEFSKEPFQRQVFKMPAKHLVRCVHDSLASPYETIRHKPGSAIYYLDGHGNPGGAVDYLVTRADFIDLGNGTAQVATYGIRPFSGNIPPDSIEVMEAARACETAKVRGYPG